VRRARFEEPATLEDFDFTFNPKVPVATIRDLATCRFIDAGESVILYGPVGVGKTHVAQSLGHAACRRGFSVTFVKMHRMLAELAGGHADGTWGQRLRRLTRIDLLVLDDFGLREFTPQAGDDFFELVSERHKTGSMVLTSNRVPADWYGLFPNPVIAEGVLDRLVNCAHHVLMEGRSYRPNKRPGARPAPPTDEEEMP
jgi:DNA replication protein DnaC